MNNANTYTGVTTISAGVLSVATIGNGGVAGNLGQASNAAANLVIGNGTLQYTGATASTNRAFTITAGQTATFDITTNDLTVSGASAVTTGALTKIGAGTLILSGANGYTGLTTVTDGTLAYGVSNALSSGGITVNGGILDIKTFSDTVGAVTLTSGSIDGTTGVLTGTSYALNGTVNTSVSAILGGAAVTLTKTGAGTATLSSANTYTGLTTISAGTLEYGVNNALSSGAVTVNGGTFDIKTFNDTVGAVTLTSGSIHGTTGVLTGTSYALNGTVNTSVSAILGGTAVALTKTGAGTATLSGANTYTGVTTISAGVLSVATIGDGGVAGNLGQASNAAANLVIGSGTLQYTGATDSTNRAFTITTGQTATFDITTNDLTVSGASAVTTGGLTKIGTGTLILSGANGYTGLTTVTDGTLAYGVSNALSSGAVTVNGGTFDIKTFSDTVGAVTLTSGSINGSTGVLTGTSYAMQNGSVSAILAGAVALNKTTAGTVTMSGANTYTGITTISGGVLSVATIGNGGVAGNLGQAAIAAANLVIGNATLQYTGATASTNRAFTITAGQTATFDITTNDLTVSGASANTTGALTKIGAGTLILSGANGYTGLTTVTDGTLAYGVTNALSSGGITVNGGTLDIKTFSDTVGAVTLTSGSIDGTTGVLTGTSYALNGTVNTSVSAILGGAVPLTKTGAGTATISGNNTYTGLTSVNVGTLRATTSANALGTGAATLDLGGGTLELANDSALNFARNTNVSANSTISSDRLTSGTGVNHTLGTLSLGGAFTLGISAGANITGGTAGITFGAATSTSNTAVIAPGAGTLLTVASLGDGNNRTYTVNGAGDMTVNGTVQTGNRPLIYGGTGTLTLSGAGTSNSVFGTNGNWAVNGGVLKLNHATALPGGIGSTGGTVGLSIGGGVVGLANGNFSRGLGTGVTQVVFTGNGGFAAFTADRTVNLGGASATVTWNAGSFVPTGSSLILSADSADKTVTFQNPIALAGAARTVQVDDGSAAVDAILSGALTGTGSSGLTKTGAGTLGISGANTYAGLTTVSTGTLLANNASGSATGTGAVSVAVAAFLGGSGTITPTGTNGISVSGVLAPGANVASIGNLTLNLGSTTGIVTMASGSGFDFDLGAAGLNIGATGTSDVLTLAGAAAGDFAFNNNIINFQNTGAIGYYKLFDTSLDLATTWTGLTVGGTGLITAGLNVSNLTSGLSGNLIMGGNSLGGTAGDIYLQVVPEPSAALLAGIGSLFLLRRRRAS